MSSTREAFNQTPLHHKPRSFFWTLSVVFLMSVSLRADLDSKSPSSCVWGGKEAESSSSSKWRASVWTPSRGALAGPPGELWWAVSAGRGGDGFLELLRAQLSRAGLQQQVVARVAHQHRVVQLLVRDGQLQVAAVFTKHVTTVPARTSHFQSVTCSIQFNYSHTIHQPINHTG